MSRQEMWRKSPLSHLFYASTATIIQANAITIQAVTLSKYTIELQDDHRHLREVSHPRLDDTSFRSPQLTLIDIAPHEWVLYWRVPSYASRRNTRRVPGIVQLPLFDLSLEEKAVGADEESGAIHPRSHLHLIPKLSEGQGTQE